MFPNDWLGDAHDISLRDTSQFFTFLREGLKTLYSTIPGLYTNTFYHLTSHLFLLLNSV